MATNCLVGIPRNYVSRREWLRFIKVFLVAFSLPKNFLLLIRGAIPKVVGKDFLQIKIYRQRKYSQ